MPSFGSLDPEILTFCELQQRMLVSLDRASMPVHIAAHHSAGGHTSGVLLITRHCSLRQVLDDLLLIWTATGAEEWRDAVYYLPLFS